MNGRRAVGDPQRIMAATDCGFETTVGFSTVAEDVVWAKLRPLRDGEAIASKSFSGEQEILTCVVSRSCE